jgi:hypothetical protein
MKSFSTISIVITSSENKFLSLSVTKLILDVSFFVSKIIFLVEDVSILYQFGIKKIYCNMQVLYIPTSQTNQGLP